MNDHAWQQTEATDDYGDGTPSSQDYYGEYEEVYKALVAARNAVHAFQVALDHYETATEWALAEMSTPDGVITIRRDNGDRGTTL